MPDDRPQLSPEQIEALGAELDALRERVMEDLGEQDLAYIRKLIKTQRALEISGRGLLFASFLPPAWVAGVAALSLSKILDNMEIGHNVMHGQYDWTGDPALSSSGFEWDTACPGDQWRHSHNYIHHTYTNILGKDRDIGYGDPADERGGAVASALAGQPAVRARAGAVLPVRRGPARPRAGDARPGRGGAPAAGAAGRHLAQGARADAEGLRAVPAAVGAAGAAGGGRQCDRQPDPQRVGLRDHLLRPLPRGNGRVRRGRRPPRRRAGSGTCARCSGSANLTGGPLFHILSGNLSHQIEHHLFPDIPARRYAEIAREVKAICERYGLPYNAGPLHTPARLGVPQDRAPRAAGVGLAGAGSVAHGGHSGGRQRPSV